MASRLKAGLNQIFRNLEVPGHAHGIASMVHMVLSDCDCDREICSMSHREIREATASPAVSAMKRGLQNNGVDIMGRDGFLVSSTHTEREIDQTLEAFENTLKAMRDEALL